MRGSADRPWSEPPPKSRGLYARVKEGLSEPRTRRRFKLAGMVALVAAGLVVALGVMLFVTRTYSFDSATYPASVRRLAVSADLGEVTAVGSDRPDTLALWQRRYSVIRPRVERGMRDGTLEISSHCPAASLRCSVIFGAQVPQATEVSARTRSAPVTVQDLNGPVAITTRSGAVTVQQVAARVRIDTQSGPVTLATLRGDIAATTVSSPIELRDVHGQVAVGSQSGPITGNSQAVEVFEATTGSGWVTATFITAPRRVQVRSASGEVSLLVPAGRYRLDLHAPGGRVRVEGVVDDPAAPRTITVTTGGGIHLATA